MTFTPLDALIEATLPGGLAVAREVAARVRAVITDQFHFGPDAIFRAIRDELAKLAPLYAQTLQDSILAAWLSATVVTAEPLFGHGEPLNLPTPEPIKEPAPIVRLPKIEAAAKWLYTKTPLPVADFEKLHAQARQGAFTVARVASASAVEKIRTALVTSVEDGGTLKMFRDDIAGAIDASPLSEASVEAIYRTNIGRAYAAGQQTVLSHPLVGDEFPYVLYSAAHDSRTRPEHLEMESLGIDGGPVYRADDPVIRRFWAPWAWHCRCACISLTLEQAANRYHVREAQEWLRSGVPPLNPAYVKPPPFDLPKGWVPVGVGQFAVAA